MSIPILTVSSHRPEEPYYCYDEFLASCRKYGHEPNVLGNMERYKGLISKPKLLLEFIKGSAMPEHIIVCDCWDVIFMRNPQEVFERYLGFNTAIVFNAERSCFPRTDLAEQFPDKGTPYRYLNSGFYIGETAAIILLLESMKLHEIPDDYQRPDGTWHHENDQGNYSQAFLEQPVPMALDSKCELVQTLHGERREDFDRAGGVILNRVTNTTPMVVHANGGGKTGPVFPLFLEVFRNQ